MGGLRRTYAHLPPGHEHPCHTWHEPTEPMDAQIDSFGTSSCFCFFFLFNFFLSIFGVLHSWISYWCPIQRTEGPYHWFKPRVLWFKKTFHYGVNRFDGLDLELFKKPTINMGQFYGKHWTMAHSYRWQTLVEFCDVNRRIYPWWAHRPIKVRSQKD